MARWVIVIFRSDQNESEFHNEKRIRCRDDYSSENIRRIPPLPHAWLWRAESVNSIYTGKDMMDRRRATDDL
jgi:hypothetical protein